MGPLGIIMIRSVAGGHQTSARPGQTYGSAGQQDMRVRKFLHENGLALMSFALFFLFWGAMAVAGYFNYNQQQQEQGQAAIAFWPYTPPVISGRRPLRTGRANSCRWDSSCF
jgi:hypothetical protein